MMFREFVPEMQVGDMSSPEIYYKTSLFFFLVNNKLILQTIILRDVLTREYVQNFK